MGVRVRRSKAGLTATWPGRIAFVHIPKTAGNSVIHAFERALGLMRCSSFASEITDESFHTRMFVAGHVQLSQITPRAYAFTFLRDPIRQIASHLRWIDHYNMPEFAWEAEAFPDSIKDAITHIAATDFTDAGSLAAFFDALPEATHLRMVNIQCEVLASEADRVCYIGTDEMAAAAIAGLDQLQFVGLAEYMEPDLHELFSRLGIRRKPSITRLNPAASTRLIDVLNPAIRRVLARQVEADLILYNEVMMRRRPLIRRAAGRLTRVTTELLTRRQSGRKAEFAEAALARTGLGTPTL